jgi:hypothetical protein
MTRLNFILIFFFVVLCIPSGQTNSVSNNFIYDTPPPVEKVNPVKKKKKKKTGKKRKRFLKKLNSKTQHYPNPEDLGNPALAFWLIFAIASILIAIFGAFVIGLGMAPWVVAFYLMLGAEITAFTILISVIWVDLPGDPAIIQFLFALLALIAVNVLIGLSFIIWGLIINWYFGWVIGLVLLGLAALFLAVHLILANKNS